MTTEEIAARHANEPGYTLIDVVEVALPVWVLDVEALVIAKKELPLVDEFILRSVQAGLVHVPQLSGFLGLNEKFLRRRISGLTGSDCVRCGRMPGSEQTSVLLTPKGRRTLVSLKEVTAQKQNLSYFYDGVTRHLVSILRNGEALRKAREIRAWGLLEVPPLPGIPPSDDELRTLDYNAFVPHQKRKRHNVHQVLSLERIGQRRKVFREARMLVYKGGSNEDLKVSFFTVHGRPLPEIDSAFAQKGGIQKLSLPRQIKESQDEWEQIKTNPIVKAGMAADERRTAADRRKVEESARDSILITSEISDTKLKLKEQETEAEKDSLNKKIAELEARLAEAVRPQSQAEFRRLTVFEHSAILDRALRDAKDRIMLVSPWITDEAMTQRRIEAIHALADRKVEIFIGYGIEEAGRRARGRERDPEDTKAYEELRDLSRRFSNLHLVRLGNTHAKLLLMDSAFAVAGSFNWMSFRGDSRRKLREEISYMVTNKAFVDKEFEHYLKGFKAPNQTPPQGRN